MEAAAGKAFEFATIVGGNVGAGGDTVFGEAVHLGGRFVGQRPQSDPSCEGALDDLARLRFAKFLLPDLHCDDHGRLIRFPRAPSLVLATDEGNVHFDGPLCPDGILVGTHHGSPELV